MEIRDSGLLVQAEPGTRRAVIIFPSVVSLSNGELLASWRCGSAKDSADASIEICWSNDVGRTWGKPQQIFGETRVNGVRGSLWLAYLTEIEPSHLLAVCMWVDREAYPGKPLFNPVTGGCAPIKLLLSDSFDFARTWTPWRILEMPRDIGPPSLTSPILKFPDGTLALSVESNKEYEDDSAWHQKVVLFHSHDLGKTWGDAITCSEDPTGRIFYWDQRANVAPDGRIAAFQWIYDNANHTYLNMCRRLSADGGQTWSPPEDLGIADQPARPAILPDGRVALAWVDRFGTASIRARLAKSVDAPFDVKTEVCLYSHGNITAASKDSISDSLVEQGRWSFGLPFAEALPDGEVLVVYYAGTPEAMSIHRARLACETLDRLPAGLPLPPGPTREGRPDRRRIQTLVASPECILLHHRGRKIGVRIFSGKAIRRKALNINARLSVRYILSHQEPGPGIVSESAGVETHTDVETG